MDRVRALKIVLPEGYVECPAAEATHLEINIPGPLPTRILPVMIGGRREGTRNWTWNGSLEAPTLRPSVLSECPPHRCHTWITDGKAHFLEDSSHEFAGQTLDLLPGDWRIKNA